MFDKAGRLVSTLDLYNFKIFPSISQPSIARRVDEGVPMRGKIVGKALIVMDARSILNACARRRFRIDLVVLAQKICEKMCLEYKDCRVILVVNEKKTETSFASALHFDFEKIGMGFQMETEDVYGTDTAIASLMLANAFYGEITHLVLVSGSRNFAITFSLINQYKGKSVYRIVCMYSFFLHQELRRQADVVYEFGRDISLAEINLERPKVVNDDEEDNDDDDDAVDDNDDKNDNSSGTQLSLNMQACS
ncbi:MAG: NYN domain-containing protein [Patescibacteria group bacterium]